MPINVSDIIKEYGSYYIKGNQNEKRLKQLLLFGRQTTKYATQIKTDDTLYRVATVSTKSIVQSFQKSYTPKGEISFAPNPIQLFQLKTDFDLLPDDIEASWLGFLASKNLKRQEWPLVRYITEHYIMKQIDHDMEVNELYKGVYTLPTEGKAGLDGQSMNGLRVLLQDKRINHVKMDALDASQIYDQLEDFFEQISEVYQHTDMIIAVAPKWYRAFLRDKRAQKFYDITSAGQINDTLDFAPARVVALPSMIGTDDVWATPTGNFIHCTKKFENAAKINIEESKRIVSFMNDWWEGIGFNIPEAVWTNVPEPPTPPSDNN